MIGAGGQTQCESPIKEVVEGAGSQLVGAHLKRVILSKFFTISRNWLTLGEALPPRAARPLMSKPQNTKNQRHD